MTEDKPNYTTTPEHFELFKAEARRWLDHLGLKGWSVHFHHDSSEESGDCLGRITWNRLGRVATIFLSVDWGPMDEPTPEAIAGTAFHEVCELFFSRIFDMAIEQNASREAVREERHHLIRTLESVLWEPENQKRQGEESLFNALKHPCTSSFDYWRGVDPGVQP